MRKVTVVLVAVALVTATVLVAGTASAFGPPSWVVEAWQNGQGGELPGRPDGAVGTRPNGDRAESPGFGPPAEVIEAWQNGQGSELPGPPAWVVDGEGPPFGPAFGPPAWVIEAWEDGQGAELPGPPAWVLDLLGL